MAGIHLPSAVAAPSKLLESFANPRVRPGTDGPNSCVPVSKDFQRPTIKAVNSLPGPLVQTSAVSESSLAIEAGPATPLFSSYFYTLLQRDLMLCSPFIPHSTKWIEIDESLPSSTSAFARGSLFSDSSRSVPASPREPYMMHSPSVMSQGRASLMDYASPIRRGRGHDFVRSDQFGSFVSRSKFGPASRYSDSLPSSPKADTGAADWLLSLMPQPSKTPFDKQH